MRYRLVHLTGSLAGRIREVDAPVVVLGRDPAGADVVFGPADRHVSRRHASITVAERVLTLRDLDSSTGTFIDGEDIVEAELHDGDVIELGQGGPQLRVEWSDGGTLMVPIPNLAAPQASEEEPPPKPLPGSKLRLTFLSGTRKDAFVEQAGAVVRIGRAKGNTVWTPEDRVVSDQHAKIVRLEDAFVLMDLESTNGTFLNGRRVERAALRDGDVVGLGTGGPELKVQVLTPDLAERLSQATVVIPNFAELARRAADTFFVREVALERDQLTLGRGPDADVRLDSPIVSRAHARVRRENGALSLQDLGSTNGTFLGPHRIEESPLRDGDRFVVGPFIFEVKGRALRLLDTRNRARLDARGLSVRAGGALILDTVSLSLPPGSFTAFIGPSGAGKSTLLRALSGARRADAGQVLLNGADLYRGFEALKATLGYVPQDDIVHQELTVGQSLEYTARLRLPADTLPGERSKRIAAVLTTLELSERRDTPIHRLSGGQRKRVSIATELLTEPNLIFLDEPTSGLDPGLEEQLMLLLRELAHKGKTIVLVTHTLDNIHLCDGVVLLVDGRLAFYGKPEEARVRFGIEHMVHLYSRLKEKAAPAWQQEFRASETHRRLVDEPLGAVPPPAPRVSSAPPPAGGFRQFRILASRYLAALNRDARNARLLVGQAPLIAGLIGLSLLYGSSDIAFTKPKNTILFLLSLVAVWFGCSNAAREIVKERAIYVRERMVNLGIFPYVLSKLVVLTGLAAVQCVIFLVILHAWFGIPGRPEQLLAAMLLASVVGILLGLALSALVSTADRAMTLLPIALIPQVLFTFPAVQMDMKGPAGIVARAMPTWWAYDLLRRVALAPDSALDDDALEAKLEAGGPVLMTRARFEKMLREGYMMFNHRSAIEMTWTASWPEALGARLPAALGERRAALVDTTALLGFAGLLLAATAALQKRKDSRE
ncbi:MAG TPA: FHA domain-containing protein [Vicinamibacteria bacterium]|nr:FHA domain-containing protein [Vicinamibacteria bacterium]